MYASVCTDCWLYTAATMLTQHTLTATHMYQDAKNGC